MTSPKDRVHLISEIRQVRNGVVVYRGDPFTASPSEAEDLLALCMATKVDHSDEEEEQLFAKPKLSTKPKLTKFKEEQSDKYRRRDLRAKE